MEAQKWGVLLAVTGHGCGMMPAFTSAAFTFKRDKKRSITLAAGISELWNEPSPARQRCPPQAPSTISDCLWISVEPSMMLSPLFLL